MGRMGLLDDIFGMGDEDIKMSGASGDKIEDGEKNNFEVGFCSGVSGNSGTANRDYSLVGNQPNVNVDIIGSIYRGNVGGMRHFRHKCHSENKASFLRENIEFLLHGKDCKPYLEILESVGGDEDSIREAIFGWDELIAFDEKGMWMWKLIPS